MTNLDEGLDFVRALGVSVERVEPDGKCADYDEDAQTLKVCRDLCPGNLRWVTDRVLRLLD